MPSKDTILFTVLAFALSSCAPRNGQIPRTNPAAASEEAEMGQQINAQILSSFYPYTEPRLVSYVSKIGNALAEHAERRDLQYHFTILYNDKIYAASAPGGFIYLTTALLYFLENESELAAVLAHEIGELQYKDPRLSRGRKILDGLTKTGAAVGPAFGQIGALAVLGLAAVHTIADKSQPSPDEKLEGADTLGLEYMVKAGYDPQGMIDVLYKFLNSKQLTPYFFDYYQSRPITEERFQALQTRFSKLPLDGKSFSANREDYQERTQGVREIYNFKS